MTGFRWDQYPLGKKDLRKYLQYNPYSLLERIQTHLQRPDLRYNFPLQSSRQQHHRDLQSFHHPWKPLRVQHW